jgi:hypothetical protein
MAKRYTKAQKERVARKLHELMSYITIVIMHTTQKIVDSRTSNKLRDQEVEILDNIQYTAQTLYEDLEPEQKKFLNKLANNVLDEL